MMLSKEEIINMILAGKPVSIIRAGDGEKLVLDSMSSVSALRLCDQAVLQRQLGYSPSLKDVEAIRNNLIEAYSKCDVIGIPNHVQKTNSHWDKVVKVLNDNVPDHTDQFCDIDLAYHMLQDDSYDRLLKNRTVLNYISCRDLDMKFMFKWHIEICNKFTISPEKKFTSGYEGLNHYPEQFNKIPRWLDVMAEKHPGTLLLVGAGVVGKIYCNWWRDRGGVAFDCGGVMDIWAGRITRGPDRGLDKINPDTTYTL